MALGSYSCLTADCAPRGLKATIKGAKGSFVLARVRLTPRVGGRLEIRLGAVELVAPDGTQSRPPALGSSTVRVAIRHECIRSRLCRHPPLSSPSQAHIRDVTGDSRVDEQDVTEVGLQWIVARNDGAVCSTTTVVTPYDANRDGCLDVSDVQAYAGGVAARPAARIVAAAVNPSFVVDSPAMGPTPPQETVSAARRHPRAPSGPPSSRRTPNRVPTRSTLRFRAAACRRSSWGVSYRP